MGAKKHEYKQLFEKIDQEEDGEVYLRYNLYIYISGFTKIKLDGEVYIRFNLYIYISGV